MRFDDIDKETRSDWLNDPTTEAFLRMLVEDRTDAVNRMVEVIKDPTADPISRLEHIGGRLAAIDDVIGRAR